MTLEQQMASFIRSLINGATVSANDQVQQNLAVAKQWLDAISKGQLIVIAPPAGKAPTETPTKGANKKAPTRPTSVKDALAANTASLPKEIRDEMIPE